MGAEEGVHPEAGEAPDAEASGQDRGRAYGDRMTVPHALTPEDEERISGLLGSTPKEAP